MSKSFYPLDETVIPPKGLAKRKAMSNEFWKKVLTGAVVAVLGALATYGTEVISTTDFGKWTPLITAGFGVFVNVLRKLILEEEQPKPPQVEPLTK